MQISITVRNGEEIDGKLQKLGQSLYDFSTELRSTGQYLVDYFSTVPFATLGRNYGSQWQDVQPATAAYKQKHYPQNAHNTLQASGKMRNSFLFSSSSFLLKVGNNAQSKDGYNYFAAHQLGLGNNPQRLVMAIDDTNQKEIIRLIEEGVTRRIAQVL